MIPARGSLYLNGRPCFLGSITEIVLPFLTKSCLVAKEGVRTKYSLNNIAVCSQRIALYVLRSLAFEKDAQQCTVLVCRDVLCDSETCSKEEALFWPYIVF